MKNDDMNIGQALKENETKIWSTADVLYSNSFKTSDWPKHMMPFFALMLIESRIVRTRIQEIEDMKKNYNFNFNSEDQESVEILNEEIQNKGYGYHPEIVKYGRTIATLCKTQPLNFRQRLKDYLEQYDLETQKLLGINYSEGTSKHLDLMGTINALNAKNYGSVDVLFNFTQRWSLVDLTLFNNSEVTTLEEHIKHRWADISAETAGEHYTPDDVINLCNKINTKIAPIDDNGSWSIYDMTCGGGNFLFGLEDELRNNYPNLSVHSYGQEFNDQLYALASIESRFRSSANIAYGNTLTNDKFDGKIFDSVIGNPPYGGDWKEFKDSVLNDKTGRFKKGCLPDVRDSQMLFLQHAVSHMAPNGVGTIVHNGSSLTSGEAGSGESNIRKYLLKDLDVVQAIIQLPSNIFFNTDINTYIWVLNNNKPKNLKNKIILINASEFYAKLKKSLNDKNCYISEDHREMIIDKLLNAENVENCQVISTDKLLYNKIDIELLRSDEDGKSIIDYSKINNINKIKIVQLEDVQEFSIQNNKIILDKLSIKEFKALISNADKIEVSSDNGFYKYEIENKIIYKDNINMGKGVLFIKTKSNKKLKENEYFIETYLNPLKEKDYEIIDYSSDEKTNQLLVNKFLKKWVDDSYTILDKKIGAEINFNKIFFKSIKLKSTSELKDEINNINNQLIELESSL